MTHIHTDTEAVDACIDTTVLTDCAPIIQKLFGPDDAEIAYDFEILMTEDSDDDEDNKTLQEELNVKYIHAHANSRTPPALVINQGQQ